MSDNINNEMGTGGADDQEPVAMGFLSPDEIEERVAAFRASLLKLDQDPAEAARIDMLIAGANAMFGDDLTAFEDPPAGPSRRNRPSSTAATALPRTKADCAGPGSSSRSRATMLNRTSTSARIRWTWKSGG